MYLNTHLLRSLVNRRNLFGMGIGVYWAIVLVGSFRVHAGNELGDMEMMKRVGGQSSYGLCTIYNSVDSDCYTPKPCPSCTLGQLNGPCTDDEGNNATNKNPEYPQECAAFGNGPYCSPGNTQDVLCYNWDYCQCELQGEEPECTTDDSQVFCINLDVGTNLPCPFTLCPP